ncbi:molybdenum cofactor guanylyltransferase [Metabacillus litoralis]|uniref:Probable molybdenum cofactor guanylyltransferase n=1 Tax=Metabacillus litoralis TaxID=152268 RepID=A0A5C6W8Q5_9BACI|nr:molybdenum cofactor guanylyltransferase [Metabacillus litoralis]TXC92176.1 molybdenum cofactor guanylyltransferase [Metabacillus litoralis]
MYNTLGVLLAGGESRRFGQPKAFATYKKQYFWEISYQAIKKVTDTNIIISQSAYIDRFTRENSVSVYEDESPYKGKGPLAGIYTAMKKEQAEWYIVLSCDIPQITSKTLENLLKFRSNHIQAIIPKISGRIQPLVGVYHSSIFPEIENQLLTNQLKLTNLLDLIDVCYVNEQDLMINQEVFSNINTQSDYHKLLNND